MIGLGSDKKVRTSHVLVLLQLSFSHSHLGEMDPKSLRKGGRVSEADRDHTGSLHNIELYPVG